MAKERGGSGAPPETVISIIGPGMHVVGECTTDGTLRIEGSVQGSVRAGKAVVVGKEGAVDGDVFTQDAVISGRIVGTLVAESRLELQATCRIEGEVRARRMQLEEGAILNGIVQMGENLQALPRVKAPGSEPSKPTGARPTEAAPSGAERTDAEPASPEPADVAPPRAEPTGAAATPDANGTAMSASAATPASSSPQGGTAIAVRYHHPAGPYGLTQPAAEHPSDAPQGGPPSDYSPSGFSGPQPS